MNIYILTRGRVGNQVTLNSIPKDMLPRTWLVASHGELHNYPRVIEAPKHVDDYNKKFAYVMGTVTTPNEQYAILDDDLNFAKRIEGTEKLRKLTLSEDEDELREMFAQVEYHLQTTVLVGIHPRQMGHAQPLPYVINTKVLRMQAINNALLPETKCLEDVLKFPILADIILTCTLLEQGLENRVITTYVQDHKSSNAPGGCSLYRTLAMQTAAVQWVAQRFAPFAKAVIKRPKTAKWLADERLDLTIQWKKLHAYGKSKRTV